MDGTGRFGARRVRRRRAPTSVSVEEAVHLAQTKIGDRDVIGLVAALGVAGAGLLFGFVFDVHNSHRARRADGADSGAASALDQDSAHVPT